VAEGVEGEEIMTEEGFPAATTRGEVEVEAAGVATLEMKAEAAGSLGWYRRWGL